MEVSLAWRLYQDLWPVCCWGRGFRYSRQPLSRQLYLCPHFAKRVQQISSGEATVSWKRGSSQICVQFLQLSQQSTLLLQVLQIQSMHYILVGSTTYLNFLIPPGDASYVLYNMYIEIEIAIDIQVIELTYKISWKHCQNLGHDGWW